MDDLCRLWGVQKSRTSPYHPEGNGVVERGNKDLGNSLRSLILARDERDWDLLLPQITRAWRATPHSFTDETANFMMFGRELSIPSTITSGLPIETQTVQQYATRLESLMAETHDYIREKQLQIRSKDNSEPPLFSVGDTVWLKNKRYKKGTTGKLATKYRGPGEILQVFENHTYLVLLQGKRSVENEVRLKRHHPAENEWGRAPKLPDLTRRPQRGCKSRQNLAPEAPLTEEEIELLYRQREETRVAEPPMALPDPIEIENVSEGFSTGENNSMEERNTELSPPPLPAEAPPPDCNESSERSNRPTRQRRAPPKLQDYVIYRIRVTNQQRAFKGRKLLSLDSATMKVTASFSRFPPASTVHSNTATLFTSTLPHEDMDAQKTRYISEETHETVRKLLAESKKESRCVKCRQYHSPNEEALRVHLWGHFVAFICNHCGFTASRASSIHRHRGSLHKGIKTTCLQTDKENWPILRELVNLPPKFPTLPINNTTVGLPKPTATEPEIDLGLSLTSSFSTIRSSSPDLRSPSPAQQKARRPTLPSEPGTNKPHKKPSVPHQLKRLHSTPKAVRPRPTPTPRGPVSTAMISAPVTARLGPTVRSIRLSPTQERARDPREYSYPISRPRPSPIRHQGHDVLHHVARQQRELAARLRRMARDAEDEAIRIDRHLHYTRRP